MREFFRGWERKLGALTLMLACVFTAGWVRSLAMTDFLVVSTFGGSLALGSTEQGSYFFWRHITSPLATID